MRCIARQSNILSRGTLCFGHSAVNILKLGKKVTTMSAPMSVSHAPDKPVIFGIDLGTHRSRVVTVEKTEEGLFKPDVMKNIPSVVTFTNNDPSKCIVGSAAKGRIITSASNTFCDTKLLIGRDYEDPVVQEVAMNKVGYKIHKSFDSRPCVLSSNFNQIFVPTDLAALILLKLKEFAEDERKTPMKNVVITKPAYFTETQVQATTEAAQMAGLNVLQIIDEPTAAIFASGENIIDKTYVVYDFGGTFKVSVVETRNHEIKVKSTVYDLFLGGDDFDNALMNYFVTRLKSLTGMDLTKNSVSMKWLKESAEGAKTDLCYRSEVDLKFYCFLVDGTLELKTVKLTRTKFEELVGEFISKTVPLCHEVLDKAKVSKSDIDEVLAIGGVSVIPKPVFGVDLGTIRTQVATIGTIDNASNGTAIPLIFEEVPSVVSFTTSNPSRCAVGWSTTRDLIPSSWDTFHATKYLLGRRFDDPLVQRAAQKNLGYTIKKSSDGYANLVSTNYNQTFTPGQITALILVKIKELAEKNLKLPMKNVFLTVPAYFTDDQIQATKEAAQMAGLNVLKIRNEHISAYMAYKPHCAENKTVVIYDFGGTFKVLVLEIQNGEISMKSTVVDLLLNGVDFDNAILNYLVVELMSMTGVYIAKDHISMKWLKKTAENAKIDLCYYPEVDIKFYCIYSNGKPQLITVKLTRTKFEELVAEIINQTIPLCHKALEDAKVRKSDIDEVFAMGGISIIPKVRATVEEIFETPLTNFEHCYRTQAVVFGALIEGCEIAFNTPASSDNLASLEVSPHLPKPVSDTESFGHTVSGDKDEVFFDVREDVLQTDIIAIITEEEADSIILRDKASQYLPIEGDANYFISCKVLFRERRGNAEAEASNEVEEKLDFIRRKKDDFVMEELRRFGATKFKKVLCFVDSDI